MGKLVRRPNGWNRDTVYKERANGKWEYWTYSDDNRVYISAAQYFKMIDQGSKAVLVT